ncbi:RNA polymerase subunit sigma, partial [bacterium]|nr:RNA polymerase subunit sigma [bacterium]
MSKSRSVTTSKSVRPARSRKNPAASRPAAPAGAKPVRDEKNEKIKELVKLANEQGYLTYGDINDILPENILLPDELDSILVLLRSMDIEIIDASEVDRFKREAAEEEKEQTKADSRLDILDDPVRM